MYMSLESHKRIINSSPKRPHDFEERGFTLQEQYEELAERYGHNCFDDMITAYYNAVSNSSPTVRMYNELARRVQDHDEKNPFEALIADYYLRFKLRGFSSEQEYENAKRNGFSTKPELNAAHARGFSSGKVFRGAKMLGLKTYNDVLEDAHDLGYKDVDNYIEDQTNGFSDINERTEARKKGFSSGEEYKTARKLGLKTINDANLHARKLNFNDFQDLMKGQANEFLKGTYDILGGRRHRKTKRSKRRKSTRKRRR